jgi:hypothetical protein
MVRKTKSDAPVAPAPTVAVVVETVAPVAEKKPKKTKAAAPVVETPYFCDIHLSNFTLVQQSFFRIKLIMPVRRSFVGGEIK